MRGIHRARHGAQTATLSRLAFRSRLLRRPTTCSATSPYLKIRSVGMARIPYSVAIDWYSSMLTLPTFTFPSYSLASSSRIGAIILQGPHHSAQKSTNTGVDALSTSCSKLASVRMTILFADIRQERIEIEVDVGSLWNHSINTRTS